MQVTFAEQGQYVVVVEDHVAEGEAREPTVRALVRQVGDVDLRVGIGVSGEERQVEFFDRRRHSLDQSLDDHGHSLATAHAHRLQPEALVGVFEGVEQCRHNASARHAEGVTKGNGAATNVELV
jgi:hypothetical protein